ncbi:tetratricopeptide repeat protein [Ruminiclostridium sufflavum DSM 19573]|uniref:Tetratricopeptide repeat protein n=1 Tax=Ruminiclostridium sufflavum DSM 19573 TaxID=1121337 RepID=A0A318Y8I4_9FIRM|nr:tetratricopeptide repeat protein [Ruminiclostridium sufflavum]PYG88534.1 tetratricopeptide repeat protein [Ruminiclostridium sufflavum DSM 19573]
MNETYKGRSRDNRSGRNKNCEEDYFYIQSKIIPHTLSPFPFLPNVFFGRKNEIDDIKGLLFRGNSRILFLNGGEGIGKTSAASGYFHLHSNEYKHAAWVHCRKNISTAILSLSKSLGIEYDEKMTEQKRLKCILQLMSSIEKPCLLIIDDVNDLEDIKNNYDKLKKCTNFHIIIISRISGIDFDKVYHVRELNEDQAFALFREYYPMHKETENCLFKEVYRAVGGNTLIIAMLAKHLYVYNELNDAYTLGSLLEDFQKKGLFICKDSHVYGTEYQVYGGINEEKPENILDALYEIDDLKKSESAVLSVFAVLPSMSISHKDVMDLLCQVRDLERHLETLAQRGWIEFNEETETYICNPLIKEVIKRKKSGMELLDDCSILIESLIGRLEYEPGTGHLTKVTYDKAAVIVEYAECILQFFRNAEKNISVLCERIGRYHATVGNLSKALEYYEECTKLKKELYEEYPANTGFKFGLAISYSQLGTAYKNIGDLNKTLMCFKEDTKLTKELYEEYPNSVALKNGLAMSYSQLGATYQNTYNFCKVLKYFEQYTKLKKELYEEYPNNVGFKNGLAVSYSKLGAAYRDTGNLPKALECFKEETKLFEELYEAYPTNIRIKNSLAISYSKLGLTYKNMNIFDKALKYFNKDTKLTKELYEDNPGNAGFKNGLAVCYSKMGIMYKNKGDLSKALQCFEEYSRLKKELYEECPDFPGFKNGLAISYSKLGSTYKNMADLDKALEYYERYIQLKKELHEEYPANVNFKNGLAIAYYKIGMFYKEYKNSKKRAYNYFLQSEKLLVELVKEIPQSLMFSSFLEQVQKKIKSF